MTDEPEPYCKQRRRQSCKLKKGEERDGTGREATEPEVNPQLLNTIDIAFTVFESMKTLTFPSSKFNRKQVQLRNNL